MRLLVDDYVTMATYCDAHLSTSVIHYTLTLIRKFFSFFSNHLVIHKTQTVTIITYIAGLFRKIN